jgi:hypothetical protein
MTRLTTFGEADRNPRVFVPEYDDMKSDEDDIDHATHSLTDDPLQIFQLTDIPEAEDEYGTRLDELTSGTADEIIDDDQRERIE